MDNVEHTAGRQELDTSAYRRVLGSFVTGVTVVTTRGADGRPYGFTANSFASVSLEPPLVLVCVGRAVEGFEVYRRCERFAINILSDSQRVISVTFATDCANRFARIRWRGGIHGSPILDGGVGSLECAAERRIEAGDHMILIGRVLAVEGSAQRPLVYFRGDYRSLAGGRESRSDIHAGEGGEPRSEEAGPDGPSLRTRTIDR